MSGKALLETQLGDALRSSPADEAELVGARYRTSLTRFAKSSIHQNVNEENTHVIARVAVGRKIGVSSTNRTDPDSLSALLEKAAEIAAESPDREGFPGFPAAERAPQVEAYSEKTAAMTPEVRAEAIARAAAIGRPDGIGLSGAFRVSRFTQAVVNTSGTAQSYDGTDAFLSVFATDENDVNGSATSYAVGVDEIDVDGVARTAIDKCKAAADPVSIDPGEMDVILEPRTMAEVVGWLSFTSLSAKQVQEGASFMSDRIGEKLMGENVSIWDDGNDPEGVPIPFDYEGVPKKRVPLIENGVVRGPVYDSLTAARDGAVSTGHASVPTMPSGPVPRNVFIAPGESTIEEIMSSVKRGLLVTSFHYLNGLLDTRRALFTGMTRAGTYLVENGSITRAVKNLRFTESMLRALSNVEAMTRERRTIGGGGWGGVSSVTLPTMLVRNFTFTGSTEF